MRILRSLISFATSLAVTSGAWAAEPKSPNAGGAVIPDVAGPAASTSPPFELIFTPIVPCRAVSGQTLGANQTKTFKVTGAGFAAQGGPAAGCGVPASAKAVAFTLTAPASSANAFVTAFAAGAPKPTTNFVVPTTGAYGVTSTIVYLGGGQMSVHSTKATTIYGDVTGYFAPQIHAVLSPSGGIYAGSERVISSENLSTGSYRVLLDRSPTSCTPIASINGGGYIASAYVGGGYIYANTYTTGGTAINLYWTLTVTC